MKAEMKVFFSCSNIDSRLQYNDLSIQSNKISVVFRKPYDCINTKGERLNTVLVAIQRET